MSDRATKEQIDELIRIADILKKNYASKNIADYPSIAFAAEVRALREENLKLHDKLYMPEWLDRP